MIGGCARHIASKLGNTTIPMLNALHDQLGKHTAIYIFDDDPSDKQRPVLLAWAAQKEFVHLILADDFGNDRIERLMLCRNVLVQQARDHLTDNGVFIMLDLDCRFPKVTGSDWHSWLQLLQAARCDGNDGASFGMNGTSSRCTSRFDVLASNNPGAYRDMWALRSERLGMAYDCFWDFEQMKTSGNCKSYRLHVHPRLAPFAIEAGFNGLAAYSAAALRRASECRHSNTSDGHVVSEHVPFQRCLWKHAVSIGLAPWFFTSCAGWKTKESSKRLFLLPNSSLALAGYSARQEKTFRAQAKKELGGDTWAPWGTNPSKVRGWYR